MGQVECDGPMDWPASHEYKSNFLLEKACENKYIVEKWQQMEIAKLNEQEIGEHFRQQNSAAKKEGNRSSEGNEM